jgi:hypothetical protein
MADDPSERLRTLIYRSPSPAMSQEEKLMKWKAEKAEREAAKMSSYIPKSQSHITSSPRRPSGRPPSQLRSRSNSLDKINNTQLSKNGVHGSLPTEPTVFRRPLATLPTNKASSSKNSSGKYQHRNSVEKAKKRIGSDASSKAQKVASDSISSFDDSIKNLKNTSLAAACRLLETNDSSAANILQSQRKTSDILDRSFDNVNSRRGSRRHQAYSPLVTFTPSPVGLASVISLNPSMPSHQKCTPSTKASPELPSPHPIRPTLCIMARDRTAEIENTTPRFSFIDCRTSPHALSPLESPSMNSDHETAGDWIAEESVGPSKVDSPGSTESAETFDSLLSFKTALQELADMEDDGVLVQLSQREVFVEAHNNGTTSSSLGGPSTPLNQGTDDSSTHVLAPSASDYSAKLDHVAPYTYAGYDASELVSVSPTVEAPDLHVDDCHCILAATNAEVSSGSKLKSPQEDTPYGSPSYGDHGLIVSLPVGEDISTPADPRKEGLRLEMADQLMNLPSLADTPEPNTPASSNNQQCSHVQCFSSENSHASNTSHSIGIESDASYDWRHDLSPEMADYRRRLRRQTIYVQNHLDLPKVESDPSAQDELSEDCLAHPHDETRGERRRLSLEAVDSVGQLDSASTNLAWPGPRTLATFNQRTVLTAIREGVVVEQPAELLDFEVVSVVEELEDQLTRLSYEKIVLEKRLSAVNKAFLDRVTPVRDAYDELRKLRTELRNERARHQAEISETAAAVEQLAEAVGRTNAKARAAELKSTELQATVDRLETENAQLKSLSEVLKGELEKLAGNVQTDDEPRNLNKYSHHREIAK